MKRTARVRVAVSSIGSTARNCNFNNLNSLDVKNGNNINMIEFKATNNDNLNCIEVDNEVFSTTNWLDIDSQSYFSEDCGYLATEDFELAGFIMSPNPTSNSVKITFNEEEVSFNTLLDTLPL